MTAEPVAWRYSHLFNGQQLPWQLTTEQWLAEREREKGAIVEPLYAAPPAAGVQAVPIPGLSAWEGWDRSRGDWSESKHKDDVLEALFRAPWSIEDAAALLGFIDRTWTRRPAPASPVGEDQRNDG